MPAQKIFPKMAQKVRQCSKCPLNCLPAVFAAARVARGGDAARAADQVHLRRPLQVNARPEVRGQQGGGRGGRRRRGREGEGTEGAVVGAALHIFVVLCHDARLVLDRPQRALLPRQVRRIDLTRAPKAFFDLMISR